MIVMYKGEMSQGVCCYPHSYDYRVVKRACPVKYVVAAQRTSAQKVGRRLALLVVEYTKLVYCSSSRCWRKGVKRTAATYNTAAGSSP